MKMVRLASITTNAVTDIDLDALSGQARRLTDQEVVLCYCASGVTGTVTLQGDKTGKAGDARAYANLASADTAAAITSVAGGVTVMFNVKLPRFLRFTAGVSAGTLNVYALIS